MPLLGSDLCLGLIDTYAFAWEGPMPGFGRRCGLRRFLDFWHYLHNAKWLLVKRNVVTRQQLSVYLSAFDGASLCKHGVFYTDVVGITRLILRRPPLCQNDQNRQVNTISTRYWLIISFNHWLPIWYCLKVVLFYLINIMMKNNFKWLILYLKK